MELEKELNELRAKLTPLKAAKFITGTLISLGATAAVIALMGSSLRNARGATKLLMKLGIFILGCKAGDVAEDYFNEKIDDLSDSFREGQETVKEALQHE